MNMLVFSRISGSSRYIIASNIDPFIDKGVTFELSTEVLSALGIQNDTILFLKVN